MARNVKYNNYQLCNFNQRGIIDMKIEIESFYVAQYIRKKNKNEYNTNNQQIKVILVCKNQYMQDRQHV